MKESIIDTAVLSLPEANDTERTGGTLACTLYAFPLTIAINGPLGAGKTTFVRGLLRASGIAEPIVSPTYALEQRYRAEQLTILHLDLYRLNEKQAHALIEQTDDHPGIRLIEWAERTGKQWLRKHRERTIVICLQDSQSRNQKPETRNQKQNAASHQCGRLLSVIFSDIPLPSRAQVEAWRREMRLPPHICHHCDAVADFADRCTGILLDRGVILRPLALRRAAEVHDLFRFLDFKDGAGPLDERRTTNDERRDPGQSTAWECIKLRYPGLRHEAACARFLTEQGFAALGSIVAAHGLSHPPGVHATIEQKLLYYADKRVMIDRVVTLEERFHDFRQRYSHGSVSDESERWYGEVQQVERELFPAKAP